MVVAFKNVEVSALCLQCSRRSTSWGGNIVSAKAGNAPGPPCQSKGKITNLRWREAHGWKLRWWLIPLPYSRPPATKSCIEVFVHTDYPDRFTVTNPYSMRIYIWGACLSHTWVSLWLTYMYVSWILQCSINSGIPLGLRSQLHLGKTFTLNCTFAGIGS